MKLYNHSQIPDEALAPVLSSAATAVHLNSKDTVVVCRTSYNWYMRVSGLAHDWSGVRRWFVAKKATTKQGKYREGMIACSGCILLRLPALYGRRFDPLALAESIFKVASHEFSHVKDYQEGKWSRSEYVRGRKKAHDKRPWEKLANRRATACASRMTTTRQDAILNLAVELERLSKLPKRGA